MGPQWSPHQAHPPPLFWWKLKIFPENVLDEFLSIFRNLFLRRHFQMDLPSLHFSSKSSFLHCYISQPGNPLRGCWLQSGKSNSWPFSSSHHGLKMSKWFDHLNRKAMMAMTSFIAKVAPLKWFLTKKLSKIFWNIESKSRLHHCWDSGPCHHSIKSAPGSQPSELNLPSQMSPRLVLTGGR